MNPLLLFSILLFFTHPLFAQNLNQLSLSELDSISKLFEAQGQYSEALSYAEKALEKAEKEAPDSVQASHSIAIADIYAMLGDYQQSEQFYNKAKKKLDSNHTLQIWIASGIGTLYYYMGDYDKCLLFFSEARDISLKKFGNNHEEYASKSTDLASIYTAMGNYEEAEYLFIEAREIFVKTVGKEHQNYLVGLNNLAQLYQYMGRYEEAEPLFLEAKELIAKSYGKEHPFYASVLNNIGLLYEDSNQKLDEAEKLFIECKEIQAQTLGIEHLDYAATLSNLAGLYSRTLQYEKAEKIYIEGKNIGIKVSGKNHPNYAKQIANLAYLYALMGRYEESEKLSLEAKDIRLKTLGEKHPDYAYSLNNMADLYVRMGKMDTALAYVKLALEANSTEPNSDILNIEKMGGLNCYSKTQLIFSISALLRRSVAMYQKNKSKDILLQSYNITKAGQDLNTKILNEFTSEASKLRLLKENNSFIAKGIEVAWELAEPVYYEEAFSMAEQNKSILLADALKSQRARALGDLPDSLVLKEVALQEELSQLKKEAAQVQDDLTKSKINEKINEFNSEVLRFKNALKEKYPKYHALKYENITANASEIQNLLKEDIVVLEYFIADPDIYLFVLSKKEVQLYRLPIKKEELDKQITVLRDALTNYVEIKNNKGTNYKKYTASAYWCYKNLVEPAKIPSNIKKLTIITDGELGHLPFESFLMKEAHQEVNYLTLNYLINQYDVNYNYSATLMKSNISSPKKQHNGKMLAFAASYEKKASPSSNATRSPRLRALRDVLDDLPAAKSEVEGLSSLFSGEFLTGKEASEAAFKTKAGDYAVLHLAMHGILNKNNPILSSLAFTENHENHEDNFLEAWEIAHLHLNADLVVLSACETGYGKFEQGEGVISLARSFMYAGTSALVVSLWQVNDYSTAEIMKGFYKNIADGMDKDAALRQAKLDYIKKAKDIAAHPAFWSPFIQLGDSRPITLGRTQVFAPAIWAIGGIIIFITAIILFRRRKK